MPDILTDAEIAAIAETLAGITIWDRMRGRDNVDEILDAVPALIASHAALRDVLTATVAALRRYAAMDEAEAFDSDGETMMVWDAPPPSVAQTALALPAVRAIADEGGR